MSWRGDDWNSNFQSTSVKAEFLEIIVHMKNGEKEFCKFEKVGLMTKSKNVTTILF